MILIVGAGIAGLALGIALAQRGIGCEIVERSPEWHTVGAGITLYPNGLRALAHLGLDDAVRGAGVAVERVRTLTARGELVAESPGESWPTFGPSVAIYRPALQRILHEAAERVPIRMDTWPVELPSDAEPGRPARVRTSDGREGEYQLVVGADGIHSSVRRRCFASSQPPRPTGQTYWRGSIRAGSVGTSTLFMGENRYVALMPIGSGRDYVAAQLFSADAPAALEPADWRPQLMQRFGDMGEPARSALEQLGDDLHFGSGLEVDRAEWRRGRVVLIGDAAHACSPVLTQGGSLAMEDAIVLAELLGETELALGQAGGASIDAALDAFVARREPRARWIREATRRYIELMNSGAEADDLVASLAEVSATLREPI